MARVISISEYRIRYQKARFYWRTTKCSYRDLARFARISTERARKWEQKFMKEKLAERKAKEKK